MGKTVRVRIAVAVGPNYWNSAGSSTMEMLNGAHMEARERLREAEGKDEANAAHIVYVECDVPMPAPMTFKGVVAPGGPK